MTRTVILFALLFAACAPNRGDAFEKSMAEARRAYHAGRFDEAATRYDQAAKTANLPRDAVHARYEAALARLRSGDVAHATAELRAIASLSPPAEDSASAAFKLAELTLATHEAAGYGELEAVATRFPENGVARLALLRVLRREDEKEGAEKTLAHLERIAPSVRDTTLEQTVLFERAKRLATLDRSKDARDGYIAIADRWPYPFGVYFDDALYGAGEMALKLGQPEEAIALWERLLSKRETSSFIGSYERPKYVPAILKIAQVSEHQLHDRKRAKEALHRLYADFKTSTLRDDALWREAELWRKDGDTSTACDRLDTLASDFPDSRYVPCAIERCPGVKRASKSKAPKTCHPYLLEDRDLSADPAPAPAPP